VHDEAHDAGSECVILHEQVPRLQIVVKSVCLV
jgi:hypothetical protein